MDTVRQKARNAEHLKRYLPDDAVNRLSQLLPLTDTRLLCKHKEHLIRLTHLTESILKVLGYINHNLGKKRADGHYEACSWNQFSGGPTSCVCLDFRFALTSIENFVTEEDEL